MRTATGKQPPTLAEPLDAMLEHAVSAARWIFDHNGMVELMFIGQNDSGDIVPMMVPDIPGNRSLLNAAITEAFRQLQVFRYAIMMETWAVNERDISDVGRGRKYASVKEHPNRYELVLIIAEDRQRRIVGELPIVRPADDKPQLGEFELATSVVGLFTGLLPKTQS